MGVPQAIWRVATDVGDLKVNEACTVIYPEDFQVYGEDMLPLCVVRVSPPQTIAPWFNLVMTRVTPGVITDGCSIRSATTRGGIRGPEGMTLAPFTIRITGAP